MLIAGIEPFSLMEYPGEVSCILFTRGCNLRCGYCHNPELVISERFSKTSQLSIDTVFAFLEKRKGLLDAVSICGGEPTLQPDLYEVVHRIKHMGFKVKLDTNGLRPEVLKRLLEHQLLDYVAMDVKMPFDEYDVITSMKADANALKRTMDILRSSKISYEYRTTVIEKVHSLSVLIRMARQLVGAQKWVLQGFRSGKVLASGYEHIPSTSSSYLANMEKKLRHIIPTIAVRG